MKTTFSAIGKSRRLFFRRNCLLPCSIYNIRLKSSTSEFKQQGCQFGGESNEHCDVFVLYKIPDDEEMMKWAIEHDNKILNGAIPGFGRTSLHCKLDNPSLENVIFFVLLQNYCQPQLVAFGSLLFL